MSDAGLQPPVPPEDLPAAWREDFERTAVWALKTLSVPNLLTGMWGNFHSRGAAEYWCGIHGGQGGYGYLHPDADRWPVLKAWLLAHPRFGPHWRRLVEAGITLRFLESSDYTTHSLYVAADSDERGLAAIRRLAKAEMGVRTAADEADFDRRFDLYLKQEWTRDDAEREAWRTREPLAVWPWKPAVA